MTSNREDDRSGDRTTRRSFLRDASVTAAAATVGFGAARRAMGRVLGANERIGVGLIGAGGRGNDHLDLVARIREAGTNVEVVAVCDVYRPRMAKAAAKCKAASYMDHRELLADANVDVVCIATPDHIHGQQVIDAVQAGRHVYCEKPLTHWRQFDLTKRMAAEVRKSRCVFQIGTQGMSDSAWHQAARLVREGLIGQPIHAECGYFRVGDWGERGMPIDDPNARPGPDLNWEAFLGDAPKRPFDVSRFFRWRMYEDYSGGPGTDLYPHSLTPVVHMLGVTMPQVVVATGGRFRYSEREVPDTFSALIDYPEKITVAVLGTQGNDHFGSTGERGSPGRRPTLRGWDGTLTFEGEEIVFTPTRGSGNQSHRFKIEQPESTERYWQTFLECCRTGRQPVASVDVAYPVQAAMQMAMMGWRAGKAARFNRETETLIV